MVDLAQVELWLDEVFDPEVPVLTIRDLGVLREVKKQDGIYHIIITPTYSGCPAMDTIKADIATTFSKHEFDNYIIDENLDHIWTTDDVSKEGRSKLEDYGIAPPAEHSTNKLALMGVSNLIKCPKCGSVKTKMISEFGSTACKALFQCSDCMEPFDYFKCLK